jgi:choline dehydrogenase-like flavoprotein
VTGTGTGQLSDAQRTMLGVLADTFAPAARPPAAEAGDPHGFWARRASDLGVAAPLAVRLEELLDDAALAELGKLLDALRLTGFRRLPQVGREAALRLLSATSADARDGIDGLRGLALQLFYGTVGADGRNPNWTELGYPGPPQIVPPKRSRLPVWSPPAGDDPIELTADVVVVGSGAGGGVIAGELSGAGLDVVVLEAGGHAEEADFPADELAALRELYWRGGLNLTEDGNVAILAGATLGGGSTINWQNCVRPPDLVRSRWATDHGLTGLEGADFDEHLDAVLDRISATSDCTDLNGVNQVLADAAERLGWSWGRAVRNTDPTSYSPETAGHVGFGDRTGSKQGTLRTYLTDAAGAGARIICLAHVKRLILDHGRTAGVFAELRLPTGARPLTVRADTVVIAAGALETPAILLRSSVGGPAVGKHLRLHPVPMITGLYDHDLKAWWGPPQATIVDEHRAAVSEHGYLVETAHLHPAISAAALPWASGRGHKLVMGRFARLGTFIAVTRDHGSGAVTIDERGEALVHYPLTDPTDAEVRRHAVRSLIELHVAAGASVILDTDRKLVMWRRGEDLDAFIQAAQDGRSGAGGRVLFSAHQMGSARMGTVGSTSVADPEGQLHDTPGVWIGDTSAFPTAVGSNPMLTCMALARRTAHAILAARRR